MVLLRRCGPAATSAALTPHFVARLGLLPAGARLDDLLFHAAIRLRGDTRGGGQRGSNTCQPTPIQAEHSCHSCNALLQEE